MNIFLIMATAALALFGCGDKQHHTPYPQTRSTEALEQWSATQPFARETAPSISNIRLYAGGHHTCALFDTSLGQQVECAGQNDHNELLFSVSDIGTIRQIALGVDHACTLTDRSVQCWGFNRDGKTVVPSHLAANPKVAKIAVGVNHSCALAEGRVSCWGADYDLQATVPDWLTAVTDLAAGGDNTCAVTLGTVKCWGRASTGVNNVPERLENPSSLVMGYKHACALVDMGVVCWGSGTGTAVQNHIDGVRQLAAGGFHTCVSNGDDTECWGENNREQSVPFGTWKGAKAIAAGLEHTCAVLESGFVCAGLNHQQQFDLSFQVKKFKSVDIKAGLGCVIEDTALKCWGDEDLKKFVPQFVRAPQLVKLGREGDVGCVATEDDLQCWFINQQKNVAPIRNIKELVVSHSFACFVTSNEKLGCVGDVPVGLRQFPALSSPRLLSLVEDRYLCVVTKDEGSVCLGSTAAQMFKPFFKENVTDFSDVRQVEIFGEDTLCYLFSDSFACGYVTEKRPSNETREEFQRNISFATFSKPVISFALLSPTVSSAPCSTSNFSNENCVSGNYDVIFVHSDPIGFSGHQSDVLDAIKGLFVQPHKLFWIKLGNNYLERISCVVDLKGILCKGPASNPVVKDNPFSNGRQ